MWNLRGLLGACCLLASQSGWTQATMTERGQPLVDVVVSQDLDAALSNRSVLQLPDGRVLVSNIGGLLVFDGARWRFHTHPQLLGNLSQLAPVDDGRVFAGFNGDLGWFAPDGGGGFTWHSLLEQLDPADRTFGAMTYVVVDRQHHGVWFVGLTRLFYFDLRTQQLGVIGGDGLHSSGFAIGTEVWFHNSERLLLRTSASDPHKLVPVEGREVLGTHMIRSAFLDQRGVLVALTNSHVFRRASGETEFQPFAEHLWPRFRTSRLSSVLALRNGNYLLTFGNGQPLVLDTDGTIVREFFETDGIPANPAHRAIEDRDGIWWIVQDRTISRVDTTRGITRFAAAQGLRGARNLARWQGTLFVGDGSALYRLHPAIGSTAARFARIYPQLSQTQCLAVLDEQRLLVGGVDIFEISGVALGELQIQLRYPTRICNTMERSRFVPGRVWAGTTQGVVRIDTSANGLIVTPLAQVRTAVFEIVEADAHSLWIADRAGGLWRTSTESTDAAPTALDAAVGLPAGAVKLFPGQTDFWLSTRAGLRQFDAQQQRFVLPAGLPGVATAQPVFSMLEDTQRRIWLRGDAYTGLLQRQDSGAYTLGDVLAGIRTNRTILEFQLEGDVLWVARSDDLLRIELDAQQPMVPATAPLISAVDDLRTQQPLQLAQLQQLPADVRQLRIAFGLPSAHRHAEHQYRSRLGGVDADWSSWSTRAERDYSHIPDGAHRFELEARDAYGRRSSAAPLLVHVGPPWFRSNWAYVGYIAAAACLLWTAARLGARRRQRMLLVRQRRLEQTVAQRTAELCVSNQQLAEQAQRLTELDRLKTRFFINVGHEFRTPLTLVLGPLDDLLRDPGAQLSPRVIEQLELANRNARRVLDLIVELLDVNRLEHGQLRLLPAQVDLLTLLRQLVDEHQPLAQRHGHRLELELNFDPDRTPALAMVDPLQLARALSNLLSNGAKYMARGGCLTLALSAPKGATAQDGWLIEVRDAGRGIAASALPHVFDRFFQAEGSDQASGYGIGLALVHEIVQAHGGRISVDSTPGVGSCFRIELPAAAAKVHEAQPAALDCADVVPCADTSVEEAGLPDALPASVAGASASRLRILVADDHADLRAHVRSLLLHRFEVLEAHDGPSAWACAQEQLPDLIVSDVMMPGFDGIELTRRLRADPDTAAIGLLLLTARAGSEHAAAALRAGANDYLVKPFDAAELLARIDAIHAHAQRLRLRLAREAESAAGSELLSPARIAANVPPEPSAEQSWRLRLEQLIVQHLDDSTLTVQRLAERLHMDRSSLFRRCKEVLGSSPSDYLRELRLQRAQQLLEQAVGNVSEVAYAVGFESLSSFTRAFKQRYGLAPSRVVQATWAVQTQRAS